MPKKDEPLHVKDREALDREAADKLQSYLVFVPVLICNLSSYQVLLNNTDHTL